jgi:hypothetical protein
LVVASYCNLILLQLGMEISRVLEAGIGSTVTRPQLLNPAERSLKHIDVRSGVLLSIPITCSLKTLTSPTEVILVLEINLGNLFLSISGLAEAASLS